MFLGVSASWFFSLGLWVLGLVICLPVHIRHQSRFALVVFGVLTAFVLVQHFLDLSPVKPYKRFFRALQSGMTEKEVTLILQREFPTDGPFPVPARTNEISFALNPKESLWNAEAIVIHLSEGRVASKEYLRD